MEVSQLACVSLYTDNQHRQAAIPKKCVLGLFSWSFRLLDTFAGMALLTVQGLTRYL